MKKSAAPRNSTGEAIRKARQDAKPKVTQADLAARLEIQGKRLSQGQIAKIENGTRTITDKELIAIAKALKVQVKDFFGKNP